MRKRIIKIVGALLAIVMLVIALLVLFPQLWMVPLLKAQFPKDKYPELYLTPTPREVKPPEHIADDFPTYSCTYSCSSLSFKTPWGELVEKKKGKLWTKFTFSQKRFVMLPNSIEEVPWPDELHRLSSGNSKDTQIDKKLFGEENLKSNYTAYKLILEASPDQISLFAPREKIIAVPILMLPKICIPVTKGKLYSFTIGDTRGFQFGDPGISKGVVIDLFDKKDDQYSVVISGKATTQSDIDFIVSSVEISN